MISGFIDASVFQNPAVDPLSLPLFTTVYNKQEELISEMHAFMKEAAGLFGLNPDVVQLDRPEILEMAANISRVSLSKLELEKYVDVKLEYHLVLMSGSNEKSKDDLRKSSLDKYVELAERICGDKEAAEFV